MCSRLIDLRWHVCPYCSVPVDRSELGVTPASAETVRILEDARSGRRKRAVAAAAHRVGIQPEELDAFTDAISEAPGRPAVGAGAVASGLPRRTLAMTEAARFRRGLRARSGTLEGNEDSGSQVETVISPADTNSTSPRGAENGFWADLFPSSDGPKDGT